MVRLDKPAPPGAAMLGVPQPLASPELRSESTAMIQHLPCFNRRHATMAATGCP